MLIKTDGLDNRTLELRLGVNRVGRDPDCDFPILHATVSTNHCELVVTDVGVMLRDCDSTNGTFLNGRRVAESIEVREGDAIDVGTTRLVVKSLQAE